jgi:hypothetical protein
MQVDYSRHMTRREICSQITLDRQITRRDIGRHIKCSRYRDNYERDMLTEYVQRSRKAGNYVVCRREMFRHITVL